MVIELGLSTFGETTPLESTGKALPHDDRIRNMIEEMVLADQVGLDVYAIGEHHREDFAVSAPEIILAAGARLTKQIRLSSAVTVLSSIDPVRLYQQYATLDALSNGRAEIMAGRGSFTESFPLFGYDLKDYDALFDEKLEMLLAIKDDVFLDWTGQFTQTVPNRPVYPRFIQPDFPLTIATGGQVESTLRIARLGLPIAYAIIGGNPKAFRQLIRLYKSVGQEYGHDTSKMTVTAHSWGWLAEDKAKAEKDYFYPTKQLVDAVSKDRPHWHELTYDAYLNSLGPDGAMFVGDPETVANKMIKMIEDLGLNRFMLHLPVGSMPHADTLNAIRLYGEEVAPRVRAHFADKS